MKTLWSSVVAEIKARNLSQSDIANRTGIDPGHLSRILNGRTNPTLESVEAILQACGMQLLAVTNRDLRDLLDARARRDAANQISGLDRSLNTHGRRPKP